MAIEGDFIRGSRAPVIVAGSTGSVAATVSLMEAVLSRPESALVLYGLEDHSSEAWAALGGHPEHPAHGLHQLFARLNLRLEDIAEIPAFEPIPLTPPLSPRGEGSPDAPLPERREQCSPLPKGRGTHGVPSPWGEGQDEGGPTAPRRVPERGAPAGAGNGGVGALHPTPQGTTDPPRAGSFADRGWEHPRGGGSDCADPPGKPGDRRTNRRARHAKRQPPEQGAPRTRAMGPRYGNAAAQTRRWRRFRSTRRLLRRQRQAGGFC